MPQTGQQLSFVDAPRVLIEYHPSVPPPDGRCPFDRAYRAALAGCPQVAGWARSEAAAVSALSARLRLLAREHPAPGDLTAYGQALTAAMSLPEDKLDGWLRSCADELVLVAPDSYERALQTHADASGPA